MAIDARDLGTSVHEVRKCHEGGHQRGSGTERAPYHTPYGGQNNKHRENEAGLDVCGVHPAVFPQFYTVCCLWPDGLTAFSPRFLQGVQRSVQRLRPDTLALTTDFLGHTVAVRPRPPPAAVIGKSGSIRCRDPRESAQPAWQEWRLEELRPSSGVEAIFGNDIGISILGEELPASAEGQVGDIQTGRKHAAGETELTSPAGKRDEGSQAGGTSQASPLLPCSPRKGARGSSGGRVRVAPRKMTPGP